MKTFNKQIACNFSVRGEPIRYIVIHDTGNPSAGSDARAHFNYFNSANRSSSADIFIDDDECWIVNDYHKYYSWHCGDGQGKYSITNSNSVGIEMCVNSDGNYEMAFRNTVDIARKLMEELNIPLDRVVRHYDASRKNCPASMNKGGWYKWNEFKDLLKEGEELTVSQYDELKNEISNLTETVGLLATKLHNIKNPMIYNYIDNNMPEWAKPTIKKLVNKGILKGDDNGLNLTEDLMRMLVINDRAGLYD